VREFCENRAFIRAVVSLPQETFFSSGASVLAVIWSKTRWLRYSLRLSPCCFAAMNRARMAMPQAPPSLAVSITDTGVLSAAAVTRWLTPEGRGDDALLGMLADREPLYFGHELADRDPSATDPDPGGGTP